LIVRELDNGSFEVINGNHRVDIAIELGIKEVMCYNLGKIPDALAKRIAIETNETKFTPDPSKLSELIRELTQTYSIDELVETMPYSASEFEAFTKSLNDFNFEGIEEHAIEDVKVGKETELGKWKRSTTVCPNCGFEF
ncbi:MAG: ParB N-terminal domain-containing protein, partial [Thermodesulfovibrio sp.]|nr:ParB N-terminal domain-containing protein [Thermodesulfovibrio sp.]